MKKSNLILIMLSIILVTFCISFSANAATYTYDDLNRLTSVTYDNGPKTTYTYDAAGNLLSVSTDSSNVEDDFQNWAEKTNVPCNKEWTIRFNVPIDTSTITNQNIFVCDAHGNQANETVLPGSECMTAIVKPPAEGYMAGQVYTLCIKNDIKSSSGKTLNKSIKMQFTIAE